MINYWKGNYRSFNYKMSYTNCHSRHILIERETVSFWMYQCPSTIDMQLVGAVATPQTEQLHSRAWIGG